MSRSYKICVEESISRVIRAEDKVTTSLEILEILPKEQMSQIVQDELAKEGYRQEGDTMVKDLEDGVRVSVDCKTCEVTVEIAKDKETAVSGKQEGWGTSATDKKAKERTEDILRTKLEKEIKEQEDKLQTEITEKLEGSLLDVRQELDRAVNRATAEALKTKAAQMGTIKEISENDSGSLTIVVEV